MPLKRTRVLVAGAGAVGSAVALRLQQAGAQVVLADPAPVGDNASGVAAGMLAPAFEAALDPASHDHFELLRLARDRWGALEADLSERVGLDRSGALWVADAAAQAAMAGRLEALGAQVRGIDRTEAERLSCGLLAPEGAAFTPEDWRLHPPRALQALRNAFAAAGGEVRTAVLREIREGGAKLRDGGSVEADAIVLATGLAPHGLESPLPEAALLTPIKGQIARFAGQGPARGPVVRAQGVYVAPAPSGPAVGATMEQGRHDRGVEPEALRPLLERASALFPRLQEAAAEGAAGVRAGTPDGLPLVGPSRTPGVLLALGARRNGWLLALDMAEAVLACLAGGKTPEAYDPGRFG